jgi:pyruvate dehydrogenase E2 component (dihydrolipoyllysine-residue acetyltransferase)
MGTLEEILVPDIGDFEDVAVIEVLVSPGDTVTPEQSLVALESDKAAMEVPSPRGGVVRELKVKLGDRVSKGSPILTLEADGSARAGAEPARPSVKPPPAAVSAPAGVAEVRVPDIGDFHDVPVIEVLVSPGDTVKPEQSLVTLESDKATMEVPSPLSGVVREMKVKVGDKVSEGFPILTLLTEAPVAAAAAPASAATAPAPAPPAPTGDIYAGPSSRRIARELGVDLGKVEGSGRKGRILPKDVEAFAKGESAKPAAPGTGLNLLSWPQVDFAKLGPIETQPLSRIRKMAAANLHRNWVMIPHVTNHEDADITDLEAFRAQINKENDASGVKVTMLAFLVKASVAALQKFPEVNGSLAPDGENLILKKYYNIGFAADTPNGLVVPVIKDAERKGVLAIARETADLAKLAREGKLKLGDIQGASFTISSLGGIGGTYFTPIINAPELAILGVSRAATKPVWDGKQFVPRLILPLSLSYDHRVIDGAAAARFNSYLAALLADMRRAFM